jgi:hypothetical protein
VSLAAVVACYLARQEAGGSAGWELGQSGKEQNFVSDLGRIFMNHWHRTIVDRLATQRLSARQVDPAMEIAAWAPPVAPQLPADFYLPLARNRGSGQAIVRLFFAW